MKKIKNVSTVSLTGLIVAVSLAGYSLSLAPPSALAGAFYTSLAAASVSISAGVAPNTDNTLEEQLKEKAAQLSVQQQHLEDLQQSLNTSRDQLGLYSLLASLLLLLLVAANFYLDWRRNQGKGGVLTKPLSVDLRALRR